jgi:ribose 1,5-bisphosphate isomerase
VLPREVAEELPYVRVRNPAFDVTPADYIDLIVTEQGAIPPELAFTVIRDYLGWTIEELQ